MSHLVRRAHRANINSKLSGTRTPRTELRTSRNAVDAQSTTTTTIFRSLTFRPIFSRAVRHGNRRLQRRSGLTEDGAVALDSDSADGCDPYGKMVRDNRRTKQQFRAG